ncbi:MAG: hypothetical protein LPK85_11335 [Gammaproteobacteria bacterium]|nr:hypothetical protein [Gammaproteobacteria bacterium]
MRRYVWLAALWTSLAGASPPATSLTLISPEIHGLVSTEGNGRYQLLFREALAQTEYVVREKVEPYKRALTTFRQREVDCILTLGDLVEAQLGEDSVVYAYPFGRFDFHMLTLQSRPVKRDLSKLKALRVVGVLGEDGYYPDLRAQGIALELVSSAEQAIRMLELDRADVFVGAMPDMQLFLDRLHYDPEVRVASALDRVACHNTLKGRTFVQRISTVLRRMHADGTYQRRLGPFYLPPQPLTESPNP